MVIKGNGGCAFKGIGTAQNYCSASPALVFLY